MKQYCLESLITLCKSGISDREITTTLGVSRSTIWRTKKKYNIPTRIRILHGITKTNVFKLWQTMMTRCYNTNRKGYNCYGGRGIVVCDAWHNPGTFCEWALNDGYQEGLQIDRINNDGNYEPNNCRFVTNKENSRNRSTTILITIGNKTQCIADWCSEIGISPFTAYSWNRKHGIEYATKRISERIDECL